MGTERARAIETQLGESTQNKGAGLWSERCTVANRGSESPLAAVARLVGRDVTIPTTVWMKLVACQC